MSYERLTERAALKAKLLAGASLLMLAPRRIGKTWLLRKIRDDMAGEGWLCIKVNVEGKRSEDEFLHELCGEIEKTQDVKSRLFTHLTQRFKQACRDGTGSLQDIIGTINARDLLEELIIALAKEKQHTLILIDEIALYVLERAKQDPGATFSLLHHLRKLQQDYPTVQWFLTGSVGLDVVARRYNMAGALLDYDSVGLEPFTADQARHYITHLQHDVRSVASFEFAVGAFEHLVNELGWLSPYYLRQIACLIQPATVAVLDESKPSAGIDDVKRAIGRMLDPNHRMHFSAWEEHIVKNFEPSDTALLRVILDVLCEGKDGEREDTIQARLTQEGYEPAYRKMKDLLINLQVDGFILLDRDRWAFRSGLLRRYWLEYMKQ